MQLRVKLAQFAAPEAFSEPEQLLAGYFAASHVGMAIINADLRFEAINPTLAAMNGVPAQEHIGRTLTEMMGPAAKEIEPVFRHVLANGQPVLDFELNAELPNRADKGHWIENFFPILGADGRVKQVGALVVEVTEQQEAGRKVSDAEQRPAAGNGASANAAFSERQPGFLPQPAGSVSRDFRIYPQSCAQ